MLTSPASQSSGAFAQQVHVNMTPSAPVLRDYMVERTFLLVRGRLNLLAFATPWRSSIAALSDVLSYLNNGMLGY